METLNLVGQTRFELAHLTPYESVAHLYACCPIKMVADGALESPRLLGYEPSDEPSCPIRY